MQDDPLSSVVLLVAVVAVMQAVGLFRQRHPRNTPMLAILGGLAFVVIVRRTRLAAL